MARASREPDPFGQAAPTTTATRAGCVNFASRGKKSRAYVVPWLEACGRFVKRDPGMFRSGDATEIGVVVCAPVAVEAWLSVRVPQ
jgi:hypothetical protein